MKELQIQRCVDGELTAPEQTQLLRELDSQQDLDAWRSLALGFVENQVFSESLKQPATAHLTAGTKQIATPRRSALLWSSLALCLGVACGILLTQSNWSALTNDLAQSPVEEVSVQGEGDLPKNIQPEQLVRAQSPEPVMHVKWQADKDQSVSLPIYSADEVARSELFQQSRAFPQQLQHQLETQGYVVDRQPRIYRVPLQDGRQILVPTESVQVRLAIH